MSETQKKNTPNFLSMSEKIRGIGHQTKVFGDFEKKVLSNTPIFS